MRRTAPILASTLTAAAGRAWRSRAPAVVVTARPAIPQPNAPALKAPALKAAVAAVAVAALAVLAWAAPAGAHAELARTDPANGAVLEASPPRVVLSFTEPVEAGLGAVRVFDGEGNRIDRGQTYRADADPLAVALDLEPLSDGIYVVTWRVVSADAHPVQGAFTLRVGPEPPGGSADAAALARRLLNAQGGSTVVGALNAATRAVVFASLIVLVGGAALLVTMWPAGVGSPPGRRLLRGAWLGAVVATIAGIGFQGAYGAGLGLSSALDPDVVAGAIETRFGRVSLARLSLLALAVPLLASLAMSLGAGQAPPPRLRQGLALVGSGLVLTPALSGHASSGEMVALAVAVDGLHLGAVSLWLGGLVLMAAVILPRADPAVVAHVVPRFSRAAFGAVVVVVATGMFQSWRQVGSVAALTDTTYGRLLVTKVVLVAVIVALGAASRAWVRDRYRSLVPVSDGPGAAAATDVSRFRRSVAAEVAVAMAVVIVTALLVNAVPGRSALALPFSTELRAGEELLVDLTVDPARARPVDMHLYTLTLAGLPAEVEAITASMTLPDRQIGPLEVPLQRAGPNHFAAYGYEVPIAGTWRIDLNVRTSPFDEVSASAEVPIR